ncbi:beta-lactamase (macronuclear) [Tetrahymena thermophila SB210]|uniref:Beta-lactamase n=1 Tax=Tetrahymena thermophila (strain SB210) TaxID=312017 RepID=I7LWC2_TETTS|nr:beta-lactamase [Tetrahymena thermophila SB210]EAS01357.1 beta-lactamase [Tetrahymena thermophila SB210]|eukprot:XP_001021603.1 beta-lactamase [Tetrahymena thermophila SB210]
MNQKQLFALLVIVFIQISSTSCNRGFESFLKKFKLNADIQENNYDWSSFYQIADVFIQNRTTPGLTVSVYYKNQSIFSAALGNQTYPGDAFNIPVNNETIYDIASLSKVFGVTAATMRLYDQGLIGLDDLVITYIPEFNNHDKANITIRNLLLHNSGLQPDLDFSLFPQSTLIPSNIKDAIYHIELQYPTGTQYVYSDLNMVILQEVVQRITKISLDVFLKLNVYGPLEMDSTMFNPSPLYVHKIAPTEFDDVYRHELCHGIVHDETAWFLGGVSGNAGIFSTANDLAKFMNMMLNRGEYINSKGKRVKIFEPETVDLFTTKETNVPYPNSRALGWDTVPIQSVLPCGTKFSPLSFGHTGFTGTTAWADKEKDLAIVILANRVYPDRNHSGTASLYFRQDTYTQICNILGY